jgi:ribonuclease HII
VASNSSTVNTKPARKPRTKPEPLPVNYQPEQHLYEIGIDEAGRGPLFGPLCVAGVVLPKDPSFDTTYIRDSKKLTKKKLDEMYDCIRAKALAYHVEFVEPKVIDEINIREAVLKAMHTCAVQCVEQLRNKPVEETTANTATNNTIPYFLCVDGNDCPAVHVDEEVIPGKAFTSGDNTFAHIAAASILAKVSRDRCILDLCEQYPKLKEKYKMDNHKGYGTKAHLDAIREFGITELHRKTFGICKTSACTPMSELL